MKNKNERDSDNKTDMFCFVMKNIHTRQCPDAAADEGEKKERGFRDTPAVFNSPALINAENNKSGRVDDNKIND